MRNSSKRVSGFLDLKQFLKHVAVENYLAEADGLLGLWGMNNFYLYRFAETGRFQFIPWDKDVTFGNPVQSIGFNTDSNVLTRRALSQRELYESYLDSLQETAKEAEGWLEQELGACLSSDPYGSLRRHPKTGGQRAVRGGSGRGSQFPALARSPCSGRH